MNSARKSEPQNEELIWEINEIVEHYEIRRTEHVNENEEDSYIQNQSDNERDSLEDNNIVLEEFNEIEAMSEDLSNSWTLYVLCNNISLYDVLYRVS